LRAGAGSNEDEEDEEGEEDDEEEDDEERRGGSLENTDECSLEPSIGNSPAYWTQ
jgi:hypothetical protein